MNFFIFGPYLLLTISTTFPNDLRKISNSEVPSAAISVICNDDKDGSRREDFIKNDQAYEIAVNPAKQPALLIFGGNRFSGSGGETYSLVKETCRGLEKDRNERLTDLPRAPFEETGEN